MDVDSRGVTTLLRHDFRDDLNADSDMGVGKPAWSPDGASIAFEHRGDGDIMPAQLFVMDADGSDPRRLTLAIGRQYAESDPAWSPDGSKIALWSFGYGVATAPATGGNPSTLYADGGVGYGAKPAWSPEGTEIAFTVRARGPWNCTLGRCRTRLVDQGDPATSILLVDGYHAVWSPDGERFAFVVAEAR
jgi:Tol biopolymer transport system component